MHMVPISKSPSDPSSPLINHNHRHLCFRRPKKRIESNRIIMISLECRKWMVLVAVIWIQAFTGTNFDFPSYSTKMKFKLKINQLHLNYLAMASDVGKLLGWCSGVLLLYFPKWIVLFMAALIGLFAYGLQWLIIQRSIPLPYFVVFILCLFAGASITWFNTVCFLLCIENFPQNWPLAVSLSVSFNGVTAALYNIIVKKLSPKNKNSSYLILNAVIPLITATAALVPILQQPDSQKNHQIDENVNKDDAYIFVCMYILAVITGLYLYFVGPASQNMFHVALLLVVLPLVLPKTIYAIKRVYLALHRDGHPVEGPSYTLVEMNHQEKHSEGPNYILVKMEHQEEHSEESSPIFNDTLRGFCGILRKNRLRVLREEHTAKDLVTRCDFWLYYIAYFCGGTIGLAYNNNLGQICQSLGYISETKALVTIYSTCSFLGRLFSATADLVGCFYLQTHTNMYTARTGRLTLAIVPIPIAFLVLVLSDSRIALHIATGLMGISCGFLISTAISITSELFGPKSSGINHNILITNIPLGSLIYGLLAAVIYDAHIGNSKEELNGSKVCIGRKCYKDTFSLWGCFSFVGFASSFLLFLRTKAAYEDDNKRRRNQIREEHKISPQDVV